MTTWILLRGLTREAGHWGAFPELLRAQLPADVRVMALDLPGNGVLNGARSLVRIETTAEACRARLQAMDIAPPYGLVAMSLGAMVAVEWASQHPAELAGCVLVNTSLRPFSPWYQRLRPHNYRALAGLVLPGPSARAKETVTLRLTTRHPPRPSAVLDAWVALREARPVAPANALRQLLAAARYRAPMRAPPVPLLAVVGAGDRLVDPACSHQLARQWRVPLAEHPSGGHDLPLDAGPWLAEAIGHWVARDRA